ncbi:hypothetical protein HFV02_00500 [Acidithiobacillus caldus]|uniref:hypothetical protein n=1 Tax=Acidithiobacillus caldus TaxID=33059 RepID=UPI001C0769ED|nr:hypothetical protein [Acidithiobacillus caldus]MBU2800767.1 hypothetical protein [Acidithiobacillus caldus]
MNGTLENTIRAALSAAGYKYHGGTWLRLRGRGLDAISINAASGGWIDHRSGERGGYRALAEKLGLGHIHSGYHEWRQEQQRQQKPYDSQQRAKTLWARAVPAVQPKKPHHYTQRDWDEAQAQYRDHREAVWSYLASRGLDPLYWMQYIKIVARLEPRYRDGTPANLDAEMLERGADFCFLIPMYQPGKTQAAPIFAACRGCSWRFLSTDTAKREKSVAQCSAKRASRS